MVTVEVLEDLSNLQKVILLLAAAADSKPIKGNTWFQKELFLIANNIKEINEETEYEADFFGPFSENAEEELEELEQEELINRDGKKIVISNYGKNIVQHLNKEFKKSDLELIEEFKILLNDLNEEELLTFIYFNFPETTNESKALKKVLKNRVKNALSLYKKEKISLAKAAEIAGKSIEQMKKLILQ